MTPEHPNEPGAFDEIVQEILDRPADDPRRRELLRAVRQTNEGMEALRSAAEPLHELRRPFEMPDLSDQILTATDRQRRFLPASVRRWVDRGRIATAAGLLLAMGVLATVHRAWPDATTLTNQPEPLSAFPRAVGHDAAQSAAFFDAEIKRAGRALSPVVADAPDLAGAAEAPAPLTAWVLSASGAEGSVFDTIMTYDPDAPEGGALRVYRVPADASRDSTLLAAPVGAAALPAPEPDPLP
ncbi:MAG: hypothetical protein DHS20C14_22210 [Phycisphaeraceae bacterium]|nr:MAG: hypothetical protein DHS20C14_22210 [Phycisphaeraceae bacterium]